MSEQQMVDATKSVERPEKGVNEWGQALSALVVVGGLAALLLSGTFQQKSSDPEPAVCEASDDARPSKPVSGVQLCTALNRADLPTLLGTPTEYAMNASGNESMSNWADGTKTVTPEAEIQLATYSVKLSTSDEDIPVAEMAGFLGSRVENRSIGGHPAVLYSDRTIALNFNLGGGKVDTGPGGIARSLLVAKDAKDGGGFYEVSIWRQDDVVPDDLALLRVAEAVLPTVPGWTAG
ncbi:hypothetical protein TUSST3_00620 [Streptomyces sp. TUS-ST3]|uniref:DUF6215 domain-containing protein n=1 Tax=Streptomyces sp. TUS-ST3 TaxID=3025591 RepID=UPI00235B4FE5|nr:DUF6215 domain-containing protein [Streptomyces sp. TUS-ST3]GLP63441.1 hypothetical protein TUSST3_00620 [Streptomyces sp. TUS-ST3]